MSDILIKDMEMPKGGYRTVEIGIDADGHPMAIGDDRNVYDVIPIPADVRPVVRGKWIWKESGEVVCSKCNDLMAIVGNTEDFITVKSYHNFCSNCGADMKAEEGET